MYQAVFEDVLVAFARPTTQRSARVLLTRRYGSVAVV